MNDKKNSGTGGVGLLGLLLVAFIILKLCGVISWSWWWVLSPLWGSIALAVLILLIVIVKVVLED